MNQTALAVFVIEKERQQSNGRRFDGAIVTGDFEWKYNYGVRY